MLKVIMSGWFDRVTDVNSSSALNREVVRTQHEVKKLDQNVTNDDVHNASISNIPRKQFVMPVEPRVTSTFGYRTLPAAYGDSKPRFHAGIDFGSWGRWNSPVKSPENGRVIMNKQSAGAGGIAYVAIKGDYTGGYHYLMHVGSKSNGPSNLVTVGQHVKAGQVVGYANKTGRVTGPHLHYAFYTPQWVNVNVVECFFKKHAPHLAAQIRNYRDKKQLHPKNKTGNCCGEWGN